MFIRLIHNSYMLISRVQKLVYLELRTLTTVTILFDELRRLLRKASSEEALRSSFTKDIYFEIQ